MIFKYLDFLIQTWNWSSLQLTGAPEIDTLGLLLPIGISFYTFQTISYTVDVYRGFIEPEKEFVLFATYVTFFPQLVAGPILRAKEVIPQLNIKPKFLINDLLSGMRKIIFGLFLKVSENNCLNGLV